jgi:hypothetical protein
MPHHVRVAFGAEPATITELAGRLIAAASELAAAGRPASAR